MKGTTIRVLQGGSLSDWRLRYFLPSCKVVGKADEASTYVISHVCHVSNIGWWSYLQSFLQSRNVLEDIACGQGCTHERQEQPFITLFLRENLRSWKFILCPGSQRKGDKRRREQHEPTSAHFANRLHDFPTSTGNIHGCFFLLLEK